MSLPLSVVSDYSQLCPFPCLSHVTSSPVFVHLQAPARAMYMLWVNILGPWFFAEAPPEQAGDDKKAKKMERKKKRLQQR